MTKVILLMGQAHVIQDERGFRRRRVAPDVACPGHMVNSHMTVI